MTIKLDKRCMLQLGVSQNFKVDAPNVVLMFQNEAADQEKVKDAVANNVIILSSAWR
jgi:hypothetical protein